jgi:hypothetical protein
MDETAQIGETAQIDETAQLDEKAQIDETVHFIFTTHLVRGPFGPLCLLFVIRCSLYILYISF